MEKIKLLFVNHGHERCGIQQFGVSVRNALLKHPAIELAYIESNDSRELAEFDFSTVSHVLFNHHSVTLYWLHQEIVNFLADSGKKVFCISGHDQLSNFSRCKNIIPDPTGVDTDRDKFTGRILPSYPAFGGPIDLPTIGSFGFGFPEKNFDRLADYVNSEFEEAKIRLHITGSHYGDPSGALAGVVVSQIQSKLKPSVQIELSTGFLSQESLVYWLSQNSVNAFLYNDQPGRGISSAVDFALASRRPVAVSNSYMFRHIRGDERNLVEKTSLKQIIKNGTAHLQKLYEEWSEQAVAERYYQILKND